ncbi:MAG: sterol 3beta-glucosyltransferase [Flavobacteriales bacterium]|jgi:sterol 3beta-glucosyltransferase
MRYGLQAWGTEGDIRPFIELAKALKANGHDVRLVIINIQNANYCNEAKHYGLDIVHVPVVHNQTHAEYFDANFDINVMGERRAEVLLNYSYNFHVSSIYEAANKLCESSDIIVRHFVDYAAQAAAELHGIPEVALIVCQRGLPLSSEPSEIISFKIPNVFLWLNQLHWFWTRLVLNKRLLPPVNDFRKQLGLDPKSDFLKTVWVSEYLSLVAVSKAICPPQECWGNSVSVVGPLFKACAEVAELDQSLVAFIDRGRKILFFTIGSFMPKVKGDALSQRVWMFSEAARQSGYDAIIQTPVIDDERFPKGEHVHFVIYAPYAQIFPHCEAVVHHGGAGTLHIVCASGVPSIIIPFIEEQYYWFKCLERLGVAGGAVRDKDVNMETLITEIRRLESMPEIKRNAQRLAANMVDDDGLSRAVEALEACN